MIQLILTIIIVAGAFVFVLLKIYRYFKYPEKRICNPDKCSSCAHSNNGECSDEYKPE